MVILGAAEEVDPGIQCGRSGSTRRREIARKKQYEYRATELFRLSNVDSWSTWAEDSRQRVVDRKSNKLQNRKVPNFALRIVGHLRFFCRYFLVLLACWEGGMTTGRRSGTMAASFAWTLAARLMTSC